MVILSAMLTLGTITAGLRIIVLDSIHYHMRGSSLKDA
jgi:hypothetical protein